MKSPNNNCVRPFRYLATNKNETFPQNIFPGKEREEPVNHPGSQASFLSTFKEYGRREFLGTRLPGNEAGKLSCIIQDNCNTRKNPYHITHPKKKLETPALQKHTLAPIRSEFVVCYALCVFFFLTHSPAS